MTNTAEQLADGLVEMGVADVHSSGVAYTQKFVGTMWVHPDHLVKDGRVAFAALAVLHERCGEVYTDINSMDFQTQVYIPGTGSFEGKGIDPRAMIEACVMAWRALESRQ